jgi:lipopolysaccharide transport system ATP-binding protein
MLSDVAIFVDSISKCYRVYENPLERLKQFLFKKIKIKYHEYWALKNITFSIKKGQTVGIIGRNGSGKSTLLQIIVGTLDSTEGEVVTSGRIAALLELGSGFNPEFTGRENVYLNAALYGLSVDEINSRFADIINFADIGDFLDQPVKIYSSGMAMRLAFAVSVNIDAEILIVDEALAVGDMAFQQKCFERLSGLQLMGVTILFVTHDILMCRNYCDSLIYLDAGEIKKIGNPELVGEEFIKDMLGAKNETESTANHAFEYELNQNTIRFGTNGGRLLKIIIGTPEGDVANLKGDEKLQVSIYGEMSKDLINPDVVIQIRDFRGYIIYGVGTVENQMIKIDKGEFFEFSAILEIYLALAPGRYSIAASLNDRTGASIFRLIDKIVGAGEFTIVKDATKNIHGCIDLNGRWLN